MGLSSLPCFSQELSLFGKLKDFPFLLSDLCRPVLFSVGHDSERFLPSSWMRWPSMFSFDVILPFSMFWRMVHVPSSNVLQADLLQSLGHFTLGFWLHLSCSPLADSVLEAWVCCGVSCCCGVCWEGWWYSPITSLSTVVLNLAVTPPRLACWCSASLRLLDSATF